jgi:hypothetical protein
MAWDLGSIAVGFVAGWATVIVLQGAVRNLLPSLGTARSNQARYWKR